MANILQVTSPDVNMDSGQAIRTGTNPGAGRIGDSGTVGGIRPDADRTQASGNPEEAAGRAVDFDSNYAAFLRRLQSSGEITEQMNELLFRDGEALLKTGDPEISALLRDLFADIEMENPDELLKYLQSQTSGQTKFSGSFFDGIRNVVRENLFGGDQEAVMRFIRSYDSYTSGSHLLHQLRTLGQNAAGQMLKAYRGDFEEALSQMDWNAENGDREANTRLLNDRIIPFLSRYISKTHDYGDIRKTAVLFSLYTIKYEEGDEGELVKAFRRLNRNGDFRLMFEDNPESSLVQKLTEQRQQYVNGSFPEAFSRLLLKGTEGKTGNESIDRYYQVLNSLLMNESAYMPILHMLIPFRYHNKNVMSEMWVDPDAQKEKNRARGEEEHQVRLLLKFRIDGLGSFDMVAIMKGRKTDLQLFVPDTVKESTRRIENAITGIFRRNDLTADITVSPRIRDIGVQEVFPEIRDSERSVNVSV